MRRSIPLAALAAAVAATLGAREAEGYCRSTTCDTPEMFNQCEGVNEACAPLAWWRSCIGWSLQEGASGSVPYDIAEGVLDAAFQSWAQAFCGPGLQIQNLGAVKCDKVEYNSAAGNTNVVVFRDAGWPHEGGDHNIGLTTVTFDVNTGEIYDADIELNSSQFDLTFEDTVVAYDLLSVATHEVGHFLGLSHSGDAEATMSQHYDMGSIAFRDLSDDDNKGICEAYPAFETFPPACNPIPRHGFSPECAASQKEGSCSVARTEAPAQTEGRGGLAAAVMALGAAVAASRRLRLRDRTRTGR